MFTNSNICYLVKDKLLIGKDIVTVELLSKMKIGGVNQFQERKKRSTGALGIHKFYFLYSSLLDGLKDSHRSFCNLATTIL